MGRCEYLLRSLSEKMGCKHVDYDYLWPRALSRSDLHDRNRDGLSEFIMTEKCDERFEFHERQRRNEEPRSIEARYDQVEERKALYYCWFGNKTAKHNNYLLHMRFPVGESATAHPKSATRTKRVSLEVPHVVCCQKIIR